MKQRIKANIGTKMVSELNLAAAYQEGQIVDLPKSDFEALLKEGLCEPVPEGVHAVASPSTDATKAKKVNE